MPSVLPVLRNRLIYASRDAEQTGAFMAAKEFRLEISPREVRSFDFVANAAYMPGSYLGYVQYGSAATIDVPDTRVRDDYWMHMSLRGACEIVNGAGATVCSADQAVFSSPIGHRTYSESGSSRLTLSVSRATMLAKLAALLGETPTRSLDFAPVMKLGTPAGRRMLRHLQLLLEEFNIAEDAELGRRLLGHYEDLIVSAVLTTQPHSFTDDLHRLDRQLMLRDVRRVVDYIEAHLDVPVTLPELVAISGIPGRTLLKHFKDRFGVSPMRYWRDQRFARVRQRLLQAVDGETVTDVATAWGFFHLGRFASEYSRRFGESPSQTRRRGS
jgi:AraC-like DNA-binding protein